VLPVPYGGISEGLVGMGKGAEGGWGASPQVGLKDAIIKQKRERRRRP